MKLLLALFWVGVSSASAWATIDLTDWSDSGISGPSYRKILQGMDELQRQYPDLVNVLSYGKSVQGRPLRLLLVMKHNRRFAEHPTLVMSGTTHGNEYLNIEDRLPRELLAKSRGSSDIARFLEEGGAYVFVPILNPDGYEHHKRENANDVDLNRDWDVKVAKFNGFQQVETRALAEKIEALRRPPYRLQYQLTVDYHCCIGALLHPWGFTRAKIPAADEARHVAIEEMAKRLLDIDGGTTGDILGYYPTGTTKDYYYDRYHALSFTFEGRYKQEKAYFPKHVQWWEEMTGYILRRNPPAFFSILRTKIRNPFAFLAD